MTAVSVVLPTYNRAGPLARSIGSVLAQTFADFELIVVDDGSTDGTAGVVAAARDPRVRYVRMEQRSGVSRARNRGVELARAAWVAFQDSDDAWLPARLAEQLPVAGDGVALVVARDRVPGEPALAYAGVPATAPPTIDLTGRARFRTPPAPTWLARREALVAAGGFDATLDCYEDWELALRLLRHGRIVLVNRVLVERTRTPGSLFSDEGSRRRNLALILERHGALLRGDRRAWSYYCNALGQMEMQAGQAAAARGWFRHALRTRPADPRAWANLAMSWCGRAAFGRYVAAARSLRRLAT